MRWDASYVAYSTAQNTIGSQLSVDCRMADGLSDGKWRRRASYSAQPQRLGKYLYPIPAHDCFCASTSMPSERALHDLCYSETEPNCSFHYHRRRHHSRFFCYCCILHKDIEEKWERETLGSIKRWRRRRRKEKNLLAGLCAFFPSIFPPEDDGSKQSFAWLFLLRSTWLDRHVEMNHCISLGTRRRRKEEIAPMNDELPK